MEIPISAMTHLADAIYDVLRATRPSNRREITYTDLISRLPAQFSNIAPDGELLAGALGELVTGCRNKGIPAISAMVIRADTRVPGNGYYPMAHPNEAHDDALRMIA